MQTLPIQNATLYCPEILHCQMQNLPNANLRSETSILSFKT